MPASYTQSVAPTITFSGTTATGEAFSYTFPIGIEDIQKTKSNEQAYLIRDGRTKVMHGLAFGQNAFNLVLYATSEFGLTNEVLNNLRKLQQDQITALLNRDVPPYINASNLHGHPLIDGIITRVDPGESGIIRGVTYYNDIRISLISNTATWS